MTSENSKEYSPADKKFYSLKNLLRDKKWDDAFELIQSHNELAKMMIGDTALHYSCFYEAPLRIISTLLRINSDATKAKNDRGHLPLHWLFWVLSKDPEVARHMLEANTSAAKVQDNHGYLPLHFAAENEEIPAESFEILLAAYPEGATVADNYGQLPLHRACCWLLGHNNLCRILISLIEANPAAVATPVDDGYFPFHLMVHQIVRKLNVESLRGLKIVLDATSNVVASTPRSFFNGGLPLHYLFNNPQSTDNFSDLWPELVAALIKAHPGALICADNDGLVPLHIAVKKWPFDEELAPAEELSEFHCELIESLIKANPNAASIPDNEGRLALHLACMFWPWNVMERLTTLVVANQDALDHVDNNGKTPLRYALERESDAHGFVVCLFLLTKHVERQKFDYTIMAIEGLSVGLVGAKKGLDEERRKNRLLEEEIAELKAENAQLRT